MDWRSVGGRHLHPESDKAALETAKAMADGFMGVVQATARALAARSDGVTEHGAGQHRHGKGDGADGGPQKDEEEVSHQKVLGSSVANAARKARKPRAYRRPRGERGSMRSSKGWLPHTGKASSRLRW